MFCAGPSQAQSKPTQTGVAEPSALSGPGTPRSLQQSGTAAPVQAAPQTSSAEKTEPKGQHEGITVHGHWIIEVKNHDGKVVSHREFENSLAPGPGGGANLLAGLLGRVATTGVWNVVLSTGFPSSILLSEPSVPCTPASTGPSTTCSNNLTVTVPSLGSNGPGATLTLAGTGVVPQIPVNSPATIDGVVTTVTVLGANVSSFNFTIRKLDGLGTDPPAVAVSPGQTVQVTVTFSFGSSN